jgi:bacterioferritin
MHRPCALPASRRRGGEDARAQSRGAGTTDKAAPRAHNLAAQHRRQETAVKGDTKVIEFLNKQLKNELTAINQYFLHARLLKHWGFGRLAKHEHDESIDEMKHADRLIERILMLDGLPNLQDLGKLLVGENAVEILRCDLKAEQAAQRTLKDGIAHCEGVRDYVSREVLSHILEDTEEHIDWLETQLELVGKLGEPNWLQTQVDGGPSS